MAYILLSLLVSLLLPLVHAVAVPGVNTAGAASTLPSATPAPGATVVYTMNMVNTGTTPGYTPWVDFLVPEGFTLTDAATLGSSYTTVKTTIPAFGCANHPFAKTSAGVADTVCNPTATPQVIESFYLPFLSYAHDQPPTLVTWTFQATGAETGVPTTPRIRSGLALGNDYFDNPTTDPSLVSHSGSSTSTWFAYPATTITTPPPPPIIPQVLGVAAGYATPVVPVSTTAYQKTITVGLPVNDRYQNIIITDTWSNKLSPDKSTITCGPCPPSWSVSPATTLPNWTGPAPGTAVPAGSNLFVINIPGPYSDTTNVLNDFIFRYNYYIPLVDSAGTNIINPTTGADTTAPHRVDLTAEIIINEPYLREDTVCDTDIPPNCVITYTPDFRDVVYPRSAFQASTQTIRSNARSTKTVVMRTNVGSTTACTCCAAVPRICAAGTKYTPGDVLEYQIQFPQGATAGTVGISSYFVYGAFVVRDTLSDGQRIDLSFTPTLTVNGVVIGAGLTYGTYTIVDNSLIGNDAAPATTGAQKITFDISPYLQAFDPVRYQNGRASSLPATPTYSPFNFVVTYRVVTQDRWSDNYWNTQSPPGVPNPNKAVVQGDVIGNSMTLDTSIFNGYTGAQLSAFPTMAAATTFTADSGSLTMQNIYGRNGRACVPSPCYDPTFPVGTNVTLRSLYVLPTGDLDALSFTYFLPFPLMDVSVVTAFVGQQGPAVPDLGIAKFGGDDTYFSNFALTPTVVKGSVSNRVDFIFPVTQNPTNTPLVIDLLFTVTIQNVLGFPDGTPINILGYSTEGLGGAQSGQQVSSTKTIIVLNQPNIEVYLAPLVTTNSLSVISPVPAASFTYAVGTVCPPGVQPSAGPTMLPAHVRSYKDSTITIVDAGDVIRFGFMILNAGAADAYDVKARGTIPAGFAVPAAGINLCVIDGAKNPVSFIDNGFFTAAGIELVDPSQLQGSIRNRNIGAGTDVVIISFDLEVTNSIIASGSLTTFMTEVIGYTAGEAGPVQASPKVTTGITTALATIVAGDQGNVGTSLPETTSAAANALYLDLAIGESIVFTLTITLGEGRTRNLVVTDVLPSGMDYVSSTVTLGSRITLTAATPTGSYNLPTRTLTFTFPDVDNAFEVPDLSGYDAGDTILITVTARVQAGLKGTTPTLVFENVGSFTSLHQTTPVTASSFAELVEPCLQRAVTNPSPTTGDAGNLFAYTIVISHCATSFAPAYNVEFKSTNTVTLMTPGGTPAATTSGAAATIVTGNGASDRQLSVLATVIPLGQTLTISYSARMDQTVVPGTVTMSHTLGYSSDPPRTATYTTSVPNVSLTCINPTLTFTYVDSSLTETTLAKLVNTNADLQPGETARFRGVIRWHEGTVPQGAVLKLAAAAAFPFEVFSATATVRGSKVTLPGITVPSSVTPTDQVGTGGILDTATFNLGIISNAWDNVANADDETEFEIQARVMSTVAAAQTNTLTASLSFSTSTTTTPISATVIVESLFPKMTVTKTRTPTGDRDAGDLITFKVTVTCTDGTNQGACYDVVAEDTLPATFTYNAGTFAFNPALPACATAGGVSKLTLTSGKITVEIPVLPVTCVAVFEYQTTILDTAVWGTTYTNAVTLNFRSAPATAPQSAAGAQLTASASVTILKPTVTITITDTSNPDTGLTYRSPTLNDIAYGEIVTVRVTARLPEGSPGTSKLTMVVDFGTSIKLQVVTSSRISVGSVTGVPVNNGVASDTATADGFNDVVTFDFGSAVVNPGSTAALDATDEIVVEAQARLMNHASNVAAALMTFTGRVVTKDTATATIQAEIVRPTTTITKSPSISGGDAGDTVTFTVTLGWPADCLGSVATASCAPIYDVVITDALSTNFNAPPTAITINGGTSTGVRTNKSTGSNIEVTVDKVLPGQTVVVTYTTTISNLAGLTATITNTANADYTPALGVNVPDIDFDPVTKITSTATITITALSVTQFAIVNTANGDTATPPAATLHVNANADLAIGEDAEYQLVLRMAEGSFTVSVVFNIPNGAAGIGEMSIVSTPSPTVTGSTTLSCSPTPCTSVVPVLSHQGGTPLDDRITYTMGTVSNTPNGVVNADDNLTFRFTLRPTDHVNNIAARILTVTGRVNSLTTQNARADLVLPFPTINVALNGPLSPDNDAGALVTMTISIIHDCLVDNSCAPIYDMRITDTLNFFQMETGTINITPAPVPALEITSGNSAGATFIDVMIRRLLPSGTPTVITFVTRVTNLALCGATLSNTASYSGVTSSGSVNPFRTITRAATAVDYVIRAVSVVGTPVTSTSLTETGTGAFGNSIVDFAGSEEAKYEIVLDIPEGTCPLTFTLNVANVSANKFTVIAGPAVPALFTGTVTTGATLGSSLTAAPAPSGAIQDTDSNLTFMERYFHQFNTITNTANGVRDANDRIALTIFFRLQSAPTSLVGNDPNQRLFYTYTANGNVLPAVSEILDVVVPTMTVVKTQSPAAGDAGDEITYTITATCTPAVPTAPAPCYEVRIRDDLNNGGSFWVLQPASTTATAGATIAKGTGVGDTVIDVTCPVVAVSGTCFVQFKTTLTNAVVAGSNVQNRGYIDSFASAPASHTPTIYGTDIVATLVNVKIASPTIGTITFTTNLGETGTDQFTNLLEDLAIGEEITYRVPIILPEGTSKPTVTLACGSSATARTGRMVVVSRQIVSVGSKITQTSFTVGSGSAGTVTNAHFADAESDTVTFAFGANVVNANDNVSDAGDVIVFELVCRVSSVSNVASGDSILSRFTVLDNSVTNFKDTTHDIVEGLATITKSGSIATGDAGDPVTFTVKVTNTGLGPLYDVIVDDILPVGLGLTTPNQVTTDVGSVTTGNTSGDTAVKITIPVLPRAAIATITYKATLGNILGGTVTNTATFSGYTADNSIGRQKTGSAQVTINISAIISLAYQYVTSSNPETDILQVINTNRDLTIGEVITYDLNMVFAEGTHDIAFTTSTPASNTVELLSCTMQFIGANLKPSFAIALNANLPVSDGKNADGVGDTCGFSSPNTLNTPDNINTVDDTATVRITVRFRNTAAAGQTATLTAQLQTGSATNNANESIDVVAPTLTIAKARNIASGDAGDLITFTVTVTNPTGVNAGPAYNVVISDPCLPNFVLVVPTVTSKIGAVDFGTITTGNGAGNTGIVINIPVFGVNAGNLIITYQARLADVVGYLTPTVTNTATITYDSDPTSAQRVGKTATATATVTVLNALLSNTVSIFATSNADTTDVKRTVGVTDLVIGETITYRLTTRLPEGQSNFSIQLTMRGKTAATDGVIQITGTRVVKIGGNGKITGGSLPAINDPANTLSDTNSDTINDRATFNFGIVTNTGDNVSVVGGDDEIVVEVTAQVTSAAVNTGTSTLTISGAVGASAATNTIDVEILVPVQGFTYSFLPTTTADAGNTVQVTLAVSNTGNGPLYSFEVQNNFNVNLEIVSGSIDTGTAPSPTIVTGSVAGENLLIRVPTIADGASFSLKYTILRKQSVGYLTLPSIANAVTASSATMAATPAARTFTTSPSLNILIDNLPIIDSFAIVGSTDPVTVKPGANTAAEDVGVAETVTLSVKLTLKEGLSSVKISVQLPVAASSAKFTYVAGSGTVFAMGSKLTSSAGLIVGSGPTSATTDLIVFNFQDVTNTFDNALDTLDQLEVRLQGLVPSDAYNVGKIGTTAVASVLVEGFPPSGVSSTVSMDIVNGNTAPTATAVQNLNVDENSGAGTVIGSAVATDVDCCAPNNVLTYSITSANGSNFNINPSTGQITVAVPGAFNHEVTQSFPLTVRATDGGGLFVSFTVNVAVNDVNEVPAMSPQTFSVSEVANNGDVFGTVTSTDPDTLNAGFSARTFSLVNGPYPFSISSAGVLSVLDATQLNTAVKSTYTVRVRVQDTPGLFVEVDMTVNLLATTCGDGLKHAREDCDDGNLTSGDGCSNLCVVEINAGCATVFTPFANSFCRTITISPSSFSEFAIIDGPSTTFDVTITKDTWPATLGTDATVTSSFLSGITGKLTSTYGFKNTIMPSLTTGSVVRVSATVARVTIPATPTYAIDAADSIETTGFPAAALTSGNALSITYMGRPITDDGLRVTVIPTGPNDLPCTSGPDLFRQMIIGDRIRLTINGSVWSKTTWESGSNSLSFFDSLSLVSGNERVNRDAHQVIVGSRADGLTTSSIVVTDNFTIDITFQVKPCGAYTARSAVIGARIANLPPATNTANLVAPVTMRCIMVYV